MQARFQRKTSSEITGLRTRPVQQEASSQARRLLTPADREHLSMEARIQAFMDGSKVADVRKFLDDETRARLHRENVAKTLQRRRGEEFICALAVMLAVASVVLTSLFILIYRA